MKGQGSTEYLVLLGVVLLVAIVVIAVLYFPAGASSDVKASQKDVGLGLGKIAYPELVDGLVVYYKFDEGLGSTAYNSAGKNVYDGTLSNGTGWASGVRGKAANFDGDGDYITFAPGSSTRCTFAAWIYPVGSDDGTSKGGLGDSSIASITSRVGLRTTDRLFRVHDGYDWRGVGQWAQGAWSHVAFTFDGQTRHLEVYLNGVRGYSNNLSTYSGCNPSTIGKHPGSILFNGSMDDVHYYKRVLAPQEIEILYKNPGYP